MPLFISEEPIRDAHLRANSSMGLRRGHASPLAALAVHDETHELLTHPAVDNELVLEQVGGRRVVVPSGSIVVAIVAGGTPAHRLRSSRAGLLRGVLQNDRHR